MVPVAVRKGLGVQGCQPEEELMNRRRQKPTSLPSNLHYLLQLDSEDAEPNFDEEVLDEYNELHMPV